MRFFRVVLDITDNAQYCLARTPPRQDRAVGENPLDVGISATSRDPGRPLASRLIDLIDDEGEVGVLAQIVLFDGFDPLDAIAPYEVLSAGGMLTGGT